MSGTDREAETTARKTESNKPKSTKQQQENKDEKQKQKTEEKQDKQPQQKQQDQKQPEQKQQQQKQQEQKQPDQKQQQKQQDQKQQKQKQPDEKQQQKRPEQKQQQQQQQQQPEKEHKQQKQTQQPSSAREKSTRRDDNKDKEQDRDGRDKQRQQDQGRRDRKSTSAGGAETNRSATSPRRNPNKIYRAPPTPAPEELHLLERSFTLDCIAVHTTSSDYARARPKLGQVIPPYNAQKDSSVDPYFKFNGVSKTLKRTGQAPPGTSLEGPTIDRFYESGAGFQYLYLRNKNAPTGHSRLTIDGHGQFMTGVQPINGYNGRFGYRRTNPALRAVPSPFGVATYSPIY